MLDRYNLVAKIFPSIVTLTPFLTIGYLYIDLSINWEGVAACGVVITAFIYIVAQMVRELGKKSEFELFTKWGGRPTTLLLSRNNKVLKSSLRKDVFKKANTEFGFSRPSKESEQSKPKKASIKLDDLTDKIVANSRDKELFPVVFNELTTYGFWRNLYGVSSYIKLLSWILMIGIWLLYFLQGELDGVNIFLVTKLFITNVILILNLIAAHFVFTEKRVRRAGERYAVALFRAFSGKK
jgi:hypothetical protein